MRFGISATSSIFPKNLRTRFRPINVCAIMSSRSIDPLGSNRRIRAVTPDPAGQGVEAIKTTLQKAAIHRDHRDRRRTTLFCRDSAENAESTRYPRHPVVITMIPAISSRNHRFPHFTRASSSQDALASHLKSPGSAPLGRGYRLSKHHLLKLNLGADLFQGRLDLGGVVLVDAFLDRLGSALDQVLGFLEPKAGDRAHFLDDLDLLVADRRQHDRELGLLFGGGRSRG